MLLTTIERYRRLGLHPYIWDASASVCHTLGEYLPLCDDGSYASYTEDRFLAEDGEQILDIEEFLVWARSPEAAEAIGRVRFYDMEMDTILAYDEDDFDECVEETPPEYWDEFWR